MCLNQITELKIIAKSGFNGLYAFLLLGLDTCDYN